MMTILMEEYSTGLRLGDVIVRNPKRICGQCNVGDYRRRSLPLSAQLHFPTAEASARRKQSSPPAISVDAVRCPPQNASSPAKLCPSASTPTKRTAHPAV